MLDLFETNIVSFTGDTAHAFNLFDANTLPVFMCFGDVFETDPQMARVRNYFADLFSPFRNEKIFLNVEFGLQLVLTLNGFEDKTLILNAFKFDKQSGSLQDLGIKLTLKVGRTKLAEPELWKEACRQPKLKIKRKEDKAKEMNPLGEQMGRVHVKQQDLKTLRLRKIKKTSGKNKKLTKKTANGKEDGGEKAQE